MLETPIHGTAADHFDPDDAPSDQLARAFIEQLRQEERTRIRRDASYTSALDGVAIDDEDDPVERIVSRNEASRQVEHVPVPADRAAVAVLVARAIDAEPGLLRRLRREAPVVVLATHLGELVEPAQAILETCAFKSGTKVKDLTLSKSAMLARNHAGLFVRDGTGKDHRPDVGNDIVGNVLHARVPLIGVAPDPKRQLPRDLIRAAEHRLSLPTLDQDGLDLVVEAVVGSRPTRKVDQDLLRTLDIADLPVALRNATSADAGIDSVVKVLAEKADYLETGAGLEDLHGYGAARDWGLALAADLKAYRAGGLSWAEIDNRGLLLSGPPGVGKTSFARALAKTARVPLVATSVADWNSADYLSGTLRAIRDAFAKARALAPCILFIDEIDGISDRATIRGEYVQYWTQVVNCLLEHLAGVEDRPGVVVVAATNHPDRIDPAVRRAGRLDREIGIAKPDSSTLARIFRHHLGPDALADESLMPLALAARGTTGADVEAFVRRARGAARRQARALILDDILAEIRQGRVPPSGAARHRTAIHEAGHAVVSRALDIGFIIDLSLHDGGGELMLGHAIDGDATLPQLDAILEVALAGRVAEEIAFDAGSIGVGLGSGSDLALATRIARDIELRFGLGGFGPIHVEASTSDLFLVNGLLGPVAARLRAASERARKILSERWKQVETIAAALDGAGYLAGAEINALLIAAGSGRDVAEACEALSAGEGR